MTTPDAHVTVNFDDLPAEAQAAFTPAIAEQFLAVAFAENRRKLEMPAAAFFKGDPTTHWLIERGYMIVVGAVTDKALFEITDAGIQRGAMVMAQIVSNKKIMKTVPDA